MSETTENARRLREALKCYGVTAEQAAANLLANAPQVVCGDPWMNQPACDPFPTEGAATMSRPNWDRELTAIAAKAWELSATTAVSFTEAYTTMLHAADLLAEAERRGAERGWQRGYEAGENFEAARWLGCGVIPRRRLDVLNPYRAGDDQ